MDKKEIGSKISAIRKDCGLTQKDNTVAIVACSNGLHREFEQDMERLQKVLCELGLNPVCSDFIYAKNGCFSGTAQERAESLMRFYRDDAVKAIFDISGGDMANEILPYLDFEVIAKADKAFWGYSDLTTIINAIYAKTGKASMLYQVRNLIYDCADMQTKAFVDTVMNNGKALTDFSYFFVQGNAMRGKVVGGNIRCFLKLAGTEFFPDVEGKILLLEAYGGKVPQMVTYLSQLKLMGVFDKISGILLGTFSKMEEEACEPNIVELVKVYAGTHVPIAKTQEIGHGVDSKGIWIGEEIEFE